MDRSYRIRTDIGSDKVLRVNMRQDVDLFEVLSLKLSQSNMYRLHTSDYGVVVGRVLANDAFGIPNAKISVFIPISDEDKLRSTIREIYPYANIDDVNSDNIRYNVLPNYRINDCHIPVGSFPSKRLVLDNDSVLEVFDKYYRYTTTTNKSGDYMLFGIPVGNQVIHVDIDLSDIGILSQKPRDFVNKGYSIDMFESPVQFKKSTNLEELPQIYTDNSSVTVYPFWGDKDSGEVAITRKDISVQYEFTPTCVFIGSVMTDNGQNSISHNCVPDENVGDAGQMVSSEGTIEMIRKTPYDSIEEFSINGNNLIDENGVWCYQIPMNLDYVGMDEYGNIVPTDNPLKGIPTRARVRFRFTLNETGDETMTRHCARYLVPNNPSVNSTSGEYGDAYKPVIDSSTFLSETYYQFGTNTPDDCFRDMYWNKVYSVKLYVPRLQVSKKEKTANYFAIKGVNKKDARDRNTIPFNKINVNVRTSFHALLQYVSENSSELKDFWNFMMSKSANYSWDSAVEDFFEENDGISLDFFNDWLNGCLYFPMWFWRIRKKKKYKNGQAVYDSQYCSCKDTNTKLKLFENYAIGYNGGDLRVVKSNEGAGSLSSYYRYYRNKRGSKWYNSVKWNDITYWKNLDGGIIKKMSNKDGADVYYYSAGNTIDIDKMRGKEYPYARLFATDIILLGSLNECDINGIPMMGTNLPSTTANIPPMGRINTEEGKEDIEPADSGETESNSGNGRSRYDDIVRGDGDNYNDDDSKETDSSYNGMNWGSYWTYNKLKGRSTDSKHPYVLGNGLLFGISYPTYISIGPVTDIKTPINASRLCELGVTLDSDSQIQTEDGKYNINFKADGLITKNELEDLDSRAMFASLNMNKLIGTVSNNTTGYKTYNLSYMYPTNFDGRLEYLAKTYTTTNNSTIPTTDDRNKDYIDFRMGRREPNRVITDVVTHVPATRERRRMAEGAFDITSRGTRIRKSITQDTIDDQNNAHFYRLDDETFRDKNRNYAFPLYENSFYFFFGLKRGSTAIDMLYKNFLQECINDEKAPFGMKVTWEFIAEGNSTITISLTNVSTPYSVFINDEEVESNLYSPTYTATVSGSGEYTVTVVDANGNSLSEKVNITYSKIKLNIEKLNDITTEYNETTASGICTSGYSAAIKFVDVNAYDCYYPVTNIDWDWNSQTGAVTYDYVGRVCTEFQSNVSLKVISPESFEDYLCDGESGVTDNGTILHINRPVDIVFFISEDGTDNSSTQTIRITDTTSPEETDEETDDNTTSNTD